MNKIQIKNRFNDSIIYEYEAENATINDAVIDAVKNRAYLIAADLSEANLSKADLSRADLSEANLSKADLSRADLSRADLSRADLSGANLSEAYLSEADLIEANLSEVNLSKALKVPMHCKWSVGITNNKIHIGCKQKTIAEWDAFFASDEVIETPRNTPEFKQIQAVYEGLKAYYQFLNS